MGRVSITQFAGGLIAGGIIAWLWGEEIRSYADARTRSIRKRAADGLQTVQENADGLLETARDQIH